MGGSRFNGLAIVEELLMEGHEVAVFNRGQTNTDLPRGVQQIRGDRKDRDSLRSALQNERFDVVQDTSAYVLEDVEWMTEIFEGRVGHYIFASSCAAYMHDYRMLPVHEEFPLNPDPGSHNDYGRNKGICERFLIDRFRKTGFPASITRYPMVFGPRNGNRFREGLMFERLTRGRQILIPGDGTVIGHLSYVKDQARSCVRMMLNPRTFGEAYNLAGPDYYTDEGYVDTLAGIVGVEAKKIFMPPDVTEEAYQTLPYPVFQRHGARLVHWSKSSIFSTRKFEEHVGYRQEHTFYSGMVESYEWHLKEGKDRYLDHDFSGEDAFIARLTQ